MSKWSALVLVVCGLLVVAVVGQRLSGATLRGDENGASQNFGEAASEPAGAGDKRTPVIVELFTSEGCSSCPSADAVLMRLDKTQPVAGVEVIALSQHVDYWNYLGWRDPFSSEQFSERQRDYAERFGRDGVYTPQMVVDGQAEFVGSNNGKALDAIAKAAQSPKATVVIESTGETPGSAPQLRVRVADVPAVSAGDAAEVWLAVTESNLAIDVARGENGGRRLGHAAVVRRLSALGGITEQKAATFSVETVVKLDGSWRRENLRAVAFVQERASRRILGAATFALAKPKT